MAPVSLSGALAPRAKLQLSLLDQESFWTCERFAIGVDRCDLAAFAVLTATAILTHSASVRRRGESRTSLPA
jgi:hypothetical protein